MVFKNKMIKAVSAFLIVMILVSAFSVAGTVSASTSASVKVGNKFRNLTHKSGFVPNSRTSKNCKQFADSVSKKLFGVKTGKMARCAYKLKTSTYKKVGTLSGKKATKKKLIKLLKKAKPGDVLQYKSSYVTSRHTAVVYSVSSKGMKILNARRTHGVYHVKMDSFSWDRVTSWPGIGSISGGNRGLSLYHCKKYNKLYGDDSNPTSITLSLDELTLKEGDEATIEATVGPSNAKDKSYTLESSNSDVVKVAGNKLIAVKAGSATITAKTVNGLTAKCKVTVTPDKSKDEVKPQETTENKVADDVTTDDAVIDDVGTDDKTTDVEITSEPDLE
jgi:uncharacterized protein YjdB